MDTRKCFAVFDKLRGLRKFAEDKNANLTKNTRRTRSSDTRFINFFSFLRDLRALRGEIVCGVALAAALCSSGCLVGPDYHRLSINTPVQFRANASADTHSIADLKWFEVFKDEQLQELIRTALVQNYDLRDAIARVEQARANLGITQADQYPNFGAGAGVTNTQQSRNGEFTIPRGTDRQRSYGTVVLSLFSFELDIWGRVRRATESARAQLLAEDWNRKAVITTLVSDVATAYFSLLELDMELAIARNTLGTREESLRLIRIQQQGGVATLLDVRQAEQLVYTARQSIFNAERQIEQTENQISLLLGRNPGSIPRSRLLTEQHVAPEVPAGLP
jgi:multidrug efflux system outer membrane protein